jgi:putative sigma-54 modulation protein
MEITFTSRHGDLPDAIKEYARLEVEGLSKYFDRLVEANIILDQEGHRNIAEVRIHSSNDTHFASSETEDMRSAVDGTVAKLKRQLQRHKDKLNRRQLTRVEREQLLTMRYRAQEEAPRDPSVAPVDWDRISSSEAIDRLGVSDEEILVFVDTLDGVVKIARRDGEESISVVEAEAFEVEDR